MTKNKPQLDADRQGELICVVTDYLNHIRHNIEDYLEGNEWEFIADDHILKPLELAELFYLAGNIQGRLHGGCITLGDIDIVEKWEKRLLSK